MIIDEKGRLFGLINLLDLLVLLAGLLAVYIGVSAYLAVRKPPLSILGITPESVQEGQTAEVALKLKNERQLVSAAVSLLPENFVGEAARFEARVKKADRNQISFTLPPTLKSGQYRVQLEVVTMDVLRRQSVHVDSLKGRVFSVTVPVAAAPSDLQNYFWQVELEAFFPARGQNVPAGLRQGSQLADSSGLVSAEVLTLRRGRPEGFDGIAGLRNGEGWTARLRVLVNFDDLQRFQDSLLATGSRMVLRSGRGYLAGYVTGRGQLEPRLPANLLQWDVDLLLLAFTEQQRQAIRAGASQKSEKGELRAQVLQVLGEQASPWIAENESAGPGKARKPSNIRVRMRLLCELMNGRLYFDGSQVQPEAILQFSLEGEKMSGTILGSKPGGFPASFYVLIPAVPGPLLPNLKPGVFVLDPNTREKIATIEQVLATDSLSLPPVLDQSGSSHYNIGYRRVLARMELDCAFRNGILYLNNQPVDFGSRFSFLLFSEQLEGVIRYNGGLPPEGKLDWREVTLEFRNVEPLVANLIQPGETDYQENAPATLKIETILSNIPARIVLNAADGQVKVSEHPLNRDIRCRVRIQVLQEGDILYYRNNQLLIGGQLSFSARRWAATGILVDF
jgi:hypothetical protein